MHHKKRKVAAGILLHRKRKDTNELEFLLVHPGGPYNKNKELGVWSIPKGEVENQELAKEAAIRELQEETGIKLSTEETSRLKYLGSVNQSSRKRVECWTLYFDRNVDTFTSNTFSLEWPPNSFKITQFPEVDKVAWLTFKEATPKIVKGQLLLLKANIDSY